MEQDGYSQRKIPIPQSLHRPSLLLGGERELVLITGLLSAVLIFITLSLPAIVMGLALWLMVIALLRRMAKADPILSKVYKRHIKYRGYYPAKSRPQRNKL